MEKKGPKKSSCPSLPAVACSAFLQGDDHWGLLADSGFGLWRKMLRNWLPRVYYSLKDERKWRKKIDCSFILLATSVTCNFACDWSTNYPLKNNIECWVLKWKFVFSARRKKPLPEEEKLWKGKIGVHLWVDWAKLKLQQRSSFLKDSVPKAKIILFLSEILWPI